MTHTNHEAGVAQPSEYDKAQEQDDIGQLVAKAVLGTVLLCIGFANIYNLIGWAQEYNQVLVYFLFFLCMSVAGMLFWGGVKGLWERVKSTHSES